MSTEEQKIKAEVDAADATLKAELAKAKADEISMSGWIKTHYAVIGAVLCLVIGFIAGRIA